MIPVTVRAATIGDIPGILAVQKMSPETSQWDAATYHTFLTARNGRSGGWVAFKGDKVIGLLLFQQPINDELEILNLAVNPDARGCGIGTKLLRRLLSGYKGHVFIEVRSNNQSAERFYRQFGFVDAGFRSGYYHNPPDDALVMVLRTQ